jgi:hypothetical protein
MFKKNEIRFAIGHEDVEVPLSETWKLWVRGSDVYLTADCFVGGLKISLHQSRACHLAFGSKEFDQKIRKQVATGRRHLLRWKRPSTAQIGPTLAVSIIFCADGEWFPNDRQNQKPSVWLHPPCDGWATEVTVVYSQQDPDNHCGDSNPKDIYLAKYRLTNGEYVALIPRPLPLPSDFFDSKVVNSIWFFYDEQESRYFQGKPLESISVASWEVSETGHFVLFSMHNMVLKQKREFSKLAGGE